MQDSQGSLHSTVGVCLVTLILPALGLKELVSHLPVLVGVAPAAVFRPILVRLRLRLRVSKMRLYTSCPYSIGGLSVRWWECGRCRRLPALRARLQILRFRHRP